MPRLPPRALRLAARLPRALHVGAIAAVAGMLAVGWLVDHQTRTAFQKRQHSQVYAELNLLRANLEGLIRGDVQLVRGLIAVLATEPEMDQERFAALASGLLGETGHIRNIAGAPGMVVRLIYPIAGNEAAVGLDYRTHPEQWAAVRRVRDGGTMVLAGPLETVQGGEALIIRAPVTAGTGAPAFWGVVSTVIDTERLYGAAGLLEPDLEVSVALVGRDGLGAAGELFFGDPAVLAAAPVTAAVDLPDGGAWMIAAVPKAGWAARPPWAWAIWAAQAVIGALVIVPLLLAGRFAGDRQRTIAALEDRERELDRLSRRLDLALSASTVGVWEYNVDRDELIWDARMNELYGMPGDKREHCYTDWRDRLHPDDLVEADATFRAAIERRARYETRFRLLLPGGVLRHIRAIGAVYRDGDGTSKIVGVNWDVTANVEREAELEAKRREAEAASVAKSRFLATMSHEIRTPMSGVLGMLDLLLDSDLDAMQRERVDIACMSARTLLAVLNDILDLSKLEAEHIALVPVATDVRALVAEVGELFRPMAEERGLALEVAVAAATPAALMCDPVRLRQIAVNLLSNAIKFTDAGQVSISAAYEPADGCLRLAVADTGIGISEREREVLFDPFTQLDSALDRRIGGTGLGLAISRQFATLMGGTLILDSVPGRGSTFVLRIPVAEVAAPVPAPSRCAPNEADGPRGLRILLVEDNPTNQLIVNALLNRAGHLVTTANNGHEALKAMAPGRFDLVLMDVQMPKLDGPSTTQAIRALGAWAATLPIIALTANAMAGDRERYLAAGMSDYISKPIDPAALFAAIRRSVEGVAAQ